MRGVRLEQRIGGAWVVGMAALGLYLLVEPWAGWGWAAAAGIGIATPAGMLFTFWQRPDGDHGTDQMFAPAVMIIAWTWAEPTAGLAWTLAACLGLTGLVGALFGDDLC